MCFEFIFNSIRSSSTRHYNTTDTISINHFESKYSIHLLYRNNIDSMNGKFSRFCKAAWTLYGANSAYLSGINDSAMIVEHVK